MMKEKEKLARDICWLGFANPKATGCTKAEYWQSLPERTRNQYIADAEYIKFVINKLGKRRIGNLFDCEKV